MFEDAIGRLSQTIDFRLSENREHYWRAVRAKADENLGLSNPGPGKEDTMSDQGHAVTPGVFEGQSPGLTSHPSIHGSGENVAELVVSLPPAAAKAVDRVLTETKDTPGQMFAKALGLYLLAIDARKHGKVVGSADSADVLDTEFTGF